VEYGTTLGAYKWPTPLTENPVFNWEGWEVNYWEPTGYPGCTGGGLVHGDNIKNGAINNPSWTGVNYASLDHSAIGVNQTILNDAVLQIAVGLPWF